MAPTLRPVLLIVVAFVIGLGLLGVLSVVAHVDLESGVDADLVADLREGGQVLLMRHALTDQSISDVDPTARGACDQQRPLSPEGREQALRVGRRLSSLEIRVSRVLASPFCRTLDTGVLLAEGAGGTQAEPTDALLSTTSVLDDEALRALVDAGADLVDASLDGDGVVVLVTHTQNIEALSGRTVEEGDTVVLGRGDGIIRVREVVPAALW